eukprot:gnl/Spiro4/17523_TR9329_c0_g1_i1.p1 gnl/Spiro4/17523_TR9329_c0_g1~~gnl/Spiro4/17523_TR9329_c0_g1_i1.p1  ORF type:complete len:152 (+),score=28.97 gnl/Spiro4/17523_TR9329_c0_g1_i1:71-526(+)
MTAVPPLASSSPLEAFLGFWRVDHGPREGDSLYSLAASTTTPREYVLEGYDGFCAWRTFDLRQDGSLGASFFSGKGDPGENDENLLDATATGSWCVDRDSGSLTLAWNPPPARWGGGPPEVRLRLDQLMRATREQFEAQRDANQDMCAQLS